MKNDNDYLKEFLRKYTNEELELAGVPKTKHDTRAKNPSVRDAINHAEYDDLAKWVETLKHDPLGIINAGRKADKKPTLIRKSAGTSPSPAPAPATPAPAPAGMTSLTPDQMNAIGVLLGGNSVDPAKVREIMDEVIAEDVKPCIDDLNTKVDRLEPLVETLESVANAMKGGASKRMPIATSIASGTTPILDVIAPYYTAGEECPTKLCVSAPPSYGKSYSVGILGRSYDAFITHGCNGDMDEWSMLLGGCQPKKEGGFIIVDGKLTEAVRSASDGKDTLLFLDEVFRMSNTTMEAMLAFLAPQPDANGDLVYQLTTKQNDGGVLEVLTCKADKLHIVCATNLSEVDPPEAFMDRFLFKHVRYNQKDIENISRGVANHHGIDNVDTLAVGFATVMGKSREKFAQGQIKKPLSIRDLSRGCTHSKDATCESVASWIADEGLDGMLMWNGDSGDIIKDSEVGVNQLRKELKDRCSDRP